MMTFTAFCRESSGQGTTWVSSVVAKDAGAAKALALVECASDWECDVSEVECFGLAEGEVNLVFWEDGEGDTGL